MFDEGLRIQEFGKRVQIGIQFQGGFKKVYEGSGDGFGFWGGARRVADGCAEGFRRVWVFVRLRLVLEGVQNAVAVRVCVQEVVRSVAVLIRRVT